MSLYGDLRTSLDGARKRYVTGRLACITFLGELHNQLSQYYECPRNAVVSFPIGSKPIAQYEPADVPSFCDQGNCWYFGIALGLGVNPRYMLLVRLRARYTDALWVGLGNEEKQFNVVDDILGLLDRIHKATREHLDKAILQTNVPDFVRIGY